MSHPRFHESTRPTRPTVLSYRPIHPRRAHQNAAPSPVDDISQKFDELEVVSKDDTKEVSEDIPVEVTGVNIPAHVTSFSEMGFRAKALSDNIRRCGYVKPTAIQRYAIPVAMAGRDLMASAQTGSGKTAAFCFPIINGILVNGQNSNTNNRMNVNRRNSVGLPMALILAPTRELSCQIHDEAKKFSHQTGVKVVVAYGGAPVTPQLRNLERGVDILVATPGRLVDMIERGKVSLRNVKYLALDEADRMLDMGFERQVRKIVQQMEMPPPGTRQTMLFSATFPVEIQRMATDFLSNYIFLAAGKVGSSTDRIVQKIEFVRDMDKKDQLVKLLSSQKAHKPHAKDALTLVFVETKRGADTLEHWLSRKGFLASAIHGDKVQMERERALKSFRAGHTPILVATDVAARGLDIPHVAHVVNLDMPRNIDDYVHRIGRTGRAGKSGVATAFFTEKNAPIAKALVELMQEANQEVPSWLIDYANTSYSGGSGSGRSSRYGGAKFGAYDCRNDANSGFSFDDYSKQSADVSAYADLYASTSSYTTEPYPKYQYPYAGADYSVPAEPYVTADYSVPAESYASGWD